MTFLNLNNNLIASMDNISDSKFLKSLQLDFNEIRVVKLEGFPMVEQLSVCYNQLVSLELTRPSLSLTELTVARNKISSLRNLARSYPNLKTLDVSANDLLYVHELSYIKELRALETLFLSSALFGQNPISKCYPVLEHVLERLPALVGLDDQRIEPGQRAQNQQIAAQKEQFYDDRIEQNRTSQMRFLFSFVEFFAEQVARTKTMQRPVHARIEQLFAFYEAQSEDTKRLVRVEQLSKGAIKVRNAPL